MKKFIKFFSLFLIVVFVASTFLNALGADPPVAKLIVSNSRGTKGADVNTTVRLENNPGIAGYGLVLKYDPTVLIYTGFSGGILPITQNDNNEIFVNNNEGIIIVVGHRATNTTTNGILFTINFEVTGAEAIDSGDYPLLLYSEYDEMGFKEGLVNQNGQSVPHQIEDGTFTLVKMSATDIKDELDSISIDENSSADEIISQIDNLFKDIDLDSLAAAIETGESVGSGEDSTTILETLEEIEKILIEALGDDYEEPTFEAFQGSDIFAENAVDIKVVGAALNSTNDRKVKGLKVAPSDELIDALPIDTPNVVVLSIQLLDEEDKSIPTLTVPVTITLPVPTALAGASVITVHHIKSSDNSVETFTVTPVNGTITFTVTSFSTFVFTTPDGEIVIHSNAHYTIEDGLMKGIAPGTTVEALRDMISATTGENGPEITDKSIFEITTANGSDIVGTGTTITVEGAPEVLYVVVVYGDVDGDGEITIIDAVRVLRASNGENMNFNDAQGTAADVAGDGNITIVSAVRVLRASNGENIVLNPNP